MSDASDRDGTLGDRTLGDGTLGDGTLGDGTPGQSALESSLFWSAGMRTWGGATFQQIGEALGLSSKTAAARYGNAVDSLFTLMSEDLVQ